ncbi:MAG: protein kinase [Pirellulales bacterium]
MKTSFDQLDPGSDRSDFANAVDELANELIGRKNFSIDRFVAGYPGLETELRRAYESLRHLHQLRDDLATATHADLLADAGQQLGDFHIVREIGRGGMGVVYEAKQLSLGRTVALKVLPFAAYFDANRLQRFKLEAQAAAALHHPNIVSVHCVGCERGVHYYAMDLVDGCSLAQCIELLRLARVDPGLPEDSDPGPIAGQVLSATFSDNGEGIRRASDTRPIAQLTTQVTSSPLEYYRSVSRLTAEIADAISYAHDQGVVHRDLKPSNILIDQRGRPWVTDFGLARVDGDSSLTATGDLLGTLRYMSPEQGEGRKLLDHRTDVYSLGATLYELLTLRPALDGTSRQEILSQLESGSIPKPGTVVRGLPRDLDTIVLKSMARFAEDRYSTAREFAEDLKRFLDRRPIVAKRSSRWHRCWQLARRHQLLASLLALIVILLLTLAIGGPLAAWSLLTARNRSLTAEHHAEMSRARLLQILTSTLSANVESLEDVPEAAAVHERMLRDTLAQYQEILRQPDLNQDARFAIASGLLKLGLAMDLRFNSEEASPILTQALELSQDLVEEAPQNAAYRLVLGDTQFAMGSLQWSADFMRQSVETLKPFGVMDRHEPQYRVSLAWAHQYLGIILATKHRLPEALTEYDRAADQWRMLVRLHPDHTESRKGLGHNHVVRGRLLQSQGKYQQSVTAISQAFELNPAVMDYIQGNTRSRIGYYQAMGDHGWALCCLKRPQEGEPLLREAWENLKQVVAEFPGSDWANHALLQVLAHLSDCRLQQNDLPGAMELVERGVKPSTMASLTDSVLRRDLTYQLGCLLVLAGRADEGSAHLRESRRLGDLQPVDDFNAVFWSSCPDEGLRDPAAGLDAANKAVGDDVQSLRLVAVALLRLERYGEAESTLKRCLKLLPSPDPIDYAYLALVSHKADRPAEALEWQTRAMELWDQPTSVFEYERRLVLDELNRVVGNNK